MLGNQHFYNRTIRKIVVAFGTLFNDIELVRYNKAATIEYERMRVPLIYASKEKFITRLQSDPTLTKSIATALPRISFEMIGINYDSTRKQQSLLKNFSPNPNGGFNTQFAPVPYNFDFTMSIYVRNQEDGTQILEQILPFFTPDFTVTVDLVPGMEQKYDMPIILNSATPDIQYEGDMLDTRMVIWTLEFTVKAFIFPPVKTSNTIIRQANTNIFIDNQVRDAQKVYVDCANGTGVFTTNEIIRVPNKGITGKVSYFSNNSMGILVVEDLTDLLVEGDSVRGDYSNALYIVDTVDLSPVKAVEIITRTEPLDAQPDDNYGYQDIITEWPDTLLNNIVRNLTTEDLDELITEDYNFITTE